MQKISFKQLTIFFIALIHISLASAKNQNFDRLVVFGDSYSDNGNVFKLTKGESPNSIRYYKGRYSDGPVWDEYLAQDFQLDPNNPRQFIDFAYGNAKIDEPVTITMYHPKHLYTIPSLSQQITLFQNKYQKFQAGDLVTVFISANDVFDVPHNEITFKKLADEQKTQIKRLIELGATHIIVLNGRDVTYSPLAKIIAEKETSSKKSATINAYTAEFRRLIQIYNLQLAKDLNSFPEVFLYDIFNFDESNINQINKQGIRYIMGGKSYTMTNYQSPCYQNLQGDYQGVAGEVCNNPYDYYFYDRIHTTSYVNYLLAKSVYQKFTETEKSK